MKRTCRTQSALVGIGLCVVVTLSGCGSSASSDPTSIPAPTSTAVTTPAGTSGAVAQVQPTGTAVVGPQLTMVTAPDGESADKNVPTVDPSKITPEPTYTSSFDKDGNGYYDYNELYAAVDAEAGKWQWPKQYPATAGILMQGFASRKDSGDRWQVPYERTIVESANRCVWEATWVDAYKAGDSALQGKSIEQWQLNLNTQVSMVDPNGIAFEQNMLDQAKLGNPAPIQQWLTNNCSILRNFVASPAA